MSDRVLRVITDATLPYRMATAVKPVLKRTSKYETARVEGRSREWLDRESLSLGRLLAQAVVQRLEDLDS